MGVDLMQAKDEAHPDLANQDIDVIHYTIIQNNVLQLTNFITTHTIRGPPEFDRHRSVTPSILLGTQRFRI